MNIPFLKNKKPQLTLIGTQEYSPEEVIGTLMLTADNREAAEVLGTSENDLYEFCQSNDINFNLRDSVKEIARNVLPEAKFTQLTRFTWATTPKTKRKRFERAAKYAEENDLVGHIKDITRDFIASGFKVFSHDQGIQDTLNGLNKDINADSIVRQLADSYATFDNLALLKRFNASRQSKQYFQGVEVPNMVHLLVHPLNTLDEDGKPQKIAGVSFPQEFIDLMKAVHMNNAMFKSLPKYAKKQLQRIPKRYKETAVQWSTQEARRFQIGMFRNVTTPFIFYDPREGEFLELYNHQGKIDRLASPTMTRIFRHIDLRDTMLDGDFTVSMFIKFLIHQVKLGDPEANKQTPWASFRSGIPNPETMNKMRDKYKTFEKILLEITGPFHEHDFVHPPIELLKPDKFINVEKNILNWGGVRIFVQAEKTTYSSGYIYTKGIQMKVNHARQAIQRMLESLYDVFLDDDASYSIRWDMDIFKEPKQIWEEISGKLNHGLLDPITAAERVSEDPKLTEAMIKYIRENNLEPYFTPIFEASQDISHAILSKKYQWDDGGTQAKPDSDPGNPNDSGEPKPNSPRQPRPSEGILEEGEELIAFDMDMGVIVKRDGKYYVYSEDRKKKLGGPYDTKKKAKERLQEIEYFKHKDD